MLSLPLRERGLKHCKLFPIISLILGWLLLGERINLGQGFAGLVVIGGVLLATWSPKKQN